ncbi:MAG: hypothetical protein IJ962_04335 [Clostridia bacterium]|nr:hypothetical protein [Clostridia bacterium]
MNRKELWNTFMKTGKVSDYLNYKKAKDFPLSDYPDEETAEEFYINNPDAKEGFYDHQNRRNSDS